MALAPQVFKYTDWLAKDTLRILKNRLMLASYFNTDDKKDFGQSFPVGATIRKEFPWRATSVEGLPYQPQSIQRRETTITIDTNIQVAWEYDSFEKALKMERPEAALRKAYSEPAAEEIAQQIESRAALWATNHCNNFVGVLGTNPTSFQATTGGARQTLLEMAAWKGKKAFIIPPKVNTSMLTGTLALFNPASAISQQYQTGAIGHQGGFDWFESMSLYSHTAATWQGTVEVTSTQTGTDAISTLVLTVTSGDTFKLGDKFSIAAVEAANPATRRGTGSSKLFTILSADQTISGTSATITISPAIYGPGSPYQNVVALPLAGADLTLFPGTASPNAKSGIIGFAITDQAFALAGVKLDGPPSAGDTICEQTQDPNSGLSVRYLRQFDGRTSSWINRIDCAIGFGDFYVDNCIGILSA
jgi:hypothetical protein